MAGSFVQHARRLVQPPRTVDVRAMIEEIAGDFELFVHDRETESVQQDATRVVALLGRMVAQSDRRYEMPVVVETGPDRQIVNTGSVQVAEVGQGPAEIIGRVERPGEMTFGGTDFLLRLDAPVAMEAGDATAEKATAQQVPRFQEFQGQMATAR